MRENFALLVGIFPPFAIQRREKSPKMEGTRLYDHDHISYAPQAQQAGEELSTLRTVRGPGTTIR